MMVRATFTAGSRGVQRIVSAPMQREDFDGRREMRRPFVCGCQQRKRDPQRSRREKGRKWFPPSSDGDGIGAGLLHADIMPRWQQDWKPRDSMQRIARSAALFDPVTVSLPRANRVVKRDRCSFLGVWNAAILCVSSQIHGGRVLMSAPIASCVVVVTQSAGPNWRLHARGRRVHDEERLGWRVR